jgi:uncharacterized protein YjeT (DUF2065 family)
MGQDWAVALALVFVLEGLVPLLWPQQWRRYVTELLGWRDGQLRFFGLVTVAVGVLLLWWLW